MASQNGKKKVVFFICLPTFLFYLLIVAVLLAVPEHHDMLVVLAVITFIFFGVFGLQAYIIKQKIFTAIVEVNELEQLLREQEQGAKMLVRRDLELSRANERLRQLDEMKSNFISVAAHQLRTPLSGIKWTVNLLLNGDLGAMNTEQTTFLMKAYESNDRMVSLVNDMLGADRIESGKIHYRFEPLQLLDLVDNILFELLPQANAKGLTIRFANRPTALPKVRADAERMRAVFQNLLENSVKYSRPNGVVEIALSAERNEIMVSIKDDGIGIPKDQQKNIFERFFRATNAVKVENEGSGLGLFIVRSIVEKHGGRIWFESQENKGVTFHFTIPVEKNVSSVEHGSIEG